MATLGYVRFLTWSGRDLGARLQGKSLCCGVVEDGCKDVYIKSKAI